MPKSRGKKKTGPSGKDLPDMRGNERIIADLHALLDEQQFGSMEEANEFLKKQIASGGFSPARKMAVTPLERAQNLIYEAWDARGPDRVDLAYRALAISPDCADAYVLLAEEAAADPGEAIRFLEEGGTGVPMKKESADGPDWQTEHPVGQKWNGGSGGQGICDLLPRFGRSAPARRAGIILRRRIPGATGGVGNNTPVLRD
jgi:hypothetical protein